MTAAERYERHAPGTGVSEAQASERMERVDHRSERQQHRRTGRTRGVVIPRVPWHEEASDDRET